jgi:hypothetical protein
MALNEFEGTVMLVSHDRALLRAVCDEFWMVSRAVLHHSMVTWTRLQRYLLDESKRLRAEAVGWACWLPLHLLSKRTVEAAGSNKLNQRQEKTAKKRT